jgi:AcrR family transcriptional regulator
MTGLREEKKSRTRALIADTAAALFADRGYPNVTMAQVAAAAGVADQTLYNYFPTKESLVFDRSDELGRSLIETVAGRPPGTGVVDAYAAWLDAFLCGGPMLRALRSPGGMPRLVASSDALHRGLLDFGNRTAASLADRLTSADGLGAHGPRADKSRADKLGADKPRAPAALAVADALLAVLVRTIEQIGAAPDEGALAGISASARAALDVLRPLG